MGTEASTRKLMEDLRAVVEDAEALLAATADQAGERARAARERTLESLKAARARLEDVETEVRVRARAAAHDTDRYVHENPWQAVGAAAALAFVVGVLLGRR